MQESDRTLAVGCGLLLTLVNLALICSLGMGLTITRGDGWVMILGMLLVDRVCAALWFVYVQPWRREGP